MAPERNPPSTHATVATPPWSTTINRALSTPIGSLSFRKNGSVRLTTHIPVRTQIAALLVPGT